MCTASGKSNSCKLDTSSRFGDQKSRKVVSANSPQNGSFRRGYRRFPCLSDIDAEFPQAYKIVAAGRLELWTP